MNEQLENHFLVFLNGTKFCLKEYLDKEILFLNPKNNSYFYKITEKYSIINWDELNVNFNNIEKKFKNFRNYNEYAQFKALVELLKPNHYDLELNNTCRALLLGIKEEIKSIPNVDTYLDCIYQNKDIYKLKKFCEEVSNLILKEDKLTKIYLEELKKIILKYRAIPHSYKKKDIMNILREAVKRGDFEEVKIWFKQNDDRLGMEIVKLAEANKSRTENGSAIYNFIKGKQSYYTSSLKGENPSLKEDLKTSGSFFYEVMYFIRTRDFAKFKELIEIKDQVTYIEYPKIINKIVGNLKIAYVTKNTTDISIFEKMYNYVYYKFLGIQNYSYGIKKKGYTWGGKKYYKVRLYIK